jgi:hypothetical protein
MPLKSKLFKGDPKLEACLISHPHHVVPGSRGEHVRKIQRALMTLGAGVIGGEETRNMFYGPDTAWCVLAFKGPPRNIINTAYQRTPDNIVGKMTIAALDSEYSDFENRPDPPPVNPFLVSLIPEGAPHDHSKCKMGGSRTGPDGRISHVGTPINPQGFGRKINIGGERETSYLGFEEILSRTPMPGIPDRRGP